MFDCCGYFADGTTVRQFGDSNDAAFELADVLVTPYSEEYDWVPQKFLKQR